MATNLEQPTSAVSDSPPIRLTEQAARWVLQRNARLGQPESALRVGVKGGGCAGYTYVTDSTQEPPGENDQVYDFSDSASTWIVAACVGLAEASSICRNH